MNQSFTLELPAGLPLLNANRRTHHHIRATRTRVIRAAAIEAVAGHQSLMETLAAAKPGPLYTRARIVGYYRPARAGRADPANWYPSFKAAVDGLVDAGLLEDDDHTRLVGPDMRLGSKTAGGQLVLVISDASGWTDVRECQTPDYAEGPCHCAHCDPRSAGLLSECTCDPHTYSYGEPPLYPDEDCPRHGNPAVLARPRRQQGLPAPAAADLTNTERQFLTFALDQAADEMALSDGFTDEDEAALEKLRRLTAEDGAA